jgi:sugar O-acyltransferase (sialic acid O-acetyltransferase NeuD family)
VVVVGAGGHARCVIDAIRSRSTMRVAGVVDDDPRLFGTVVRGFRITGDVLSVIEAAAAPRTAPVVAVVGVGGNGDTRPRRHLHHRLLDAGVCVPTVVHAAATVSPSARIATGAQILAAAVVNADASVGEGALVNTGAVVGHDARVGAFAQVAPNATLGGASVVGDGAHVGPGAVVLEARRIGAGALVAAGAVVTRDVAPGSRVFGIPARTLGEFPGSPLPEEGYIPG